MATVTGMILGSGSAPGWAAEAPASEADAPAEADSEPTAESAEPDEDLYKEVEEIRVTSRSGGGSLQSMGVSAAIFDAAYLKALGAENIQDISQFTPNLEIPSVFAASNPTIFIRGVGLLDFNANSQSSVAIYNDDIYMSSPAGQLGQFFDLAGIEVLRGPQGALYGRNASAGAILIKSRRPTGEAGGFSRVDYGRFNGLEVEGAVEVPITDALSARAAGRFRSRDGTLHNRCGDPAYVSSDGPVPFPGARGPQDINRNTGCFNANLVLTGPFALTHPPWKFPQAPRVDEWLNQAKNWAGRFTLRFQPSEEMDWLLKFQGGMNRGGASQFQSIGANQGSQLVPRKNGVSMDGYYDFDLQYFNETENRYRTYFDPAQGDPYEGDYNINEPESLDLYGGSLTGDIEVADNLFFKTITGYEANRRHVKLDLDASPFVSLEPTLANSSWQVSQEFKLIWEGEGPISAEFGASYMYEHLAVWNYFELKLPLLDASQDYTLDTQYGSVYAYLSWALGSRLSIDAGGRWNFESKMMDLTARTLDFGGGLIREQYAQEHVTDNAPSGNITLNFTPTEDHLMYLKYSRGYKGPHINGGVLSPYRTGESGAPLTNPVKPEIVDALELGVKTAWFDNQVYVNGAAFFYDYQDIQIFQLRNSGSGLPVQQLLNASHSKIYGAEVEVRVFPLYGRVPEEIEALEVFLSFGWLDAYYSDFINTQTTQTMDGFPFTQTENLTGNRLINSPDLAFAGYAAWTFVSSYGNLTPRVDWTYKGSVFFSTINSPYAGQEAFWLLNLRLGYTTPDGQVEFSAWVRNLTDEVYRLNVLNLARFRRQLLYLMGDPRTYGVGIQVRF